MAEKTPEQIRAHTAAQAKYDKEHTVRIGFKFNRETDADVLEWFSQQESRQSAIKKLIREAISQGK